jgi:aspartyl protease family protein
MSLGAIDWNKMDGDTIVPILVCCLLLAWYLPAAVSKYRGKSSKALGHAAIWFAMIVVLIGGYAFRPELAFIKDRMAGVLIPGRATDKGDGTIVISKSSDDDHFSIAGYINNQSTSFVLDTGASAVVLTHDTAQRLGLLVGEDGYTQTVSTANGMTKVAPIRIDELRIASIVLKDVKASVARQGELDENLLGMSFLSRLKGYAVEADQLTLRQ